MDEAIEHSATEASLGALGYEAIEKVEKPEHAAKKLIDGVAMPSDSEDDGVDSEDERAAAEYEAAKAAAEKSLADGLASEVDDGEAKEAEVPAEEK